MFAYLLATLFVAWFLWELVTPPKKVKFIMQEDHSKPYNYIISDPHGKQLAYDLGYKAYYAGRTLSEATEDLCLIKSHENQFAEGWEDASFGQYNR